MFPGVQAHQERDLRTPLSLVGELSREGLWFGSASAERSSEAAFGGVMSSSRNMMFSACTHKNTPNGSEAKIVVWIILLNDTCSSVKFNPFHYEIIVTYKWLMIILHVL